MFENRLQLDNLVTTMTQEFLHGAIGREEKQAAWERIRNLLTQFDPTIHNESEDMRRPISEALLQIQEEANQIGLHLNELEELIERWGPDTCCSAAKRRVQSCTQQAWDQLAACRNSISGLLLHCLSKCVECCRSRTTSRCAFS